jgi:hypothetical protein
VTAVSLPRQTLDRLRRGSRALVKVQTVIVLTVMYFTVVPILAAVIGLKRYFSGPQPSWHARLRPEEDGQSLRRMF